MHDFCQQLKAGACATFLTLPRESLILVQHPHWFSLIKPTFTVIALSIVLLTLMLFFYTSGAVTLTLFLGAGLVILLFSSTIITKVIVEWYYHFYLISSRRILEVQFAPFFYHEINNVLLDQVRTTEIRVHISNPLYEFLNIGNVRISFDLPSHDTSIDMNCIADPHAVGARLSDALESLMHDSAIWFRPRNEPDSVRMSDVVYPRRQLSGV